MNSDVILKTTSVMTLHYTWFLVNFAIIENTLIYYHPWCRLGQSRSPIFML